MRAMLVAAVIHFVNVKDNDAAGIQNLPICIVAQINASSSILC